ncbi:kinesin-like protein KIN-7E isoform X2 [Diospyros lotus]|nr:kinesin-like protein KIN-7E isoform X2 [Diospyros lotus]
MTGITEYTAADIYDYLHKHKERAFVLKFSAMEIYNEAIRDLLSTDSLPLRVLDDPEKGTVVEKLTEEILRDLNHLKKLLSICEAQRKTGETSLNETSSRSHQILRLTIESSAREFLGEDNSTALSASVNFVDLAGSERASQALSVGTRLKEGCHINRSLLTLGTVIRKLSNGKHGHVNYRDSKLTRILQPSLGGNARTAIICTLSPARSHVEQSRNTLLFATCAKEVTTNAKVNVVMSDKALVKHLQKELARLENELRTPAPSSTCNCAALLRKKDLQIEKLEKDMTELIKQRDLAESRVQDLLGVAGNDQTSRHWGRIHDDHKLQGDKWEDECSVSELSFNDKGHSLSNGSLSMLSGTGKFVRTGAFHCIEEFTEGAGEDSDDTCKEVQCIEMDESSKDRVSESLALSAVHSEGTLPLMAPRFTNLTDEEIESNPPREVSHIQDNLAHGTLEQRIQDVQKTINSHVIPCPDDPSPWSSVAGMPSSRNQQLNRSWSCRATFMAGSSSPYFEKVEGSQNTPPNGFEKSFPGRPEGLPFMLPRVNYGAAKLSRNDSLSSIGSAFVEELKAQKNKNSNDDDIPTIDTFVAGMKEMARVEYEKQLATCQGTEQAEESGKNSKDVGLDPMLDTLDTPASWPLEFERKQKAILELWQSCNISLVHRTYFFLLFKGDPADSIYVEVELRRLFFLKEAFSQGNHAVEDGRTLTLASSFKALRREREMLSRLMYRRFSEAERNKLYQKWGISLVSKRRRVQVANRLWSNPSDMEHIVESAAIVGKLIGFSEQGGAPKEMFGLRFTPQRTSRRSFGWKHSMASLL